MRYCANLVRLKATILFGVLSFVNYGYAQTDLSPETAPNIIIPDTIVDNATVHKYRVFYDMLEHRSSNSGFMKMLYKAVVRDDRRSELQTDRRLREGLPYFEQYEGKTIRNIQIFRSNVYDLSDGLFKFLNATHAVTQEGRIARSLLFREGESVNAVVMVQNEQLLRGMGFLSSANIVIMPSDIGNDDEVDVYVITRDRWSINIQLRSAHEGYYFKVYDKNFMGTGYTLGLRTYLDYKPNVYGGNMLELTTINLFGTFFNGEFYAGKGYEEQNYSAKVNKDFIRSSDYMAGASVSYERHYDGQFLSDTTYLTRFRDFKLWTGKAWHVPGIKNSLFLTAAYEDVRLIDRPEVAVDSSSYYHSYHALLFSAGIYRESFYRGNMIYGFGRTEDVPYGYKLEFVGGRYFGEFENKWYGAASFTVGAQSKIGYIRWKLFADSFMTEDGNLRQGSLSADFGWFSNLIYGERSYIRQFLDIHYTKGYGRDKGEGERLVFNNIDSPNGYKFNKTPMSGNDRLVIRTETVFFSPLYLYGFRFAFFGFGDIGWLGDRSAVFTNDFYSALGVGVRIKNERLVFPTFQFRLGVALNKRGLPSYNHFRYTSASEFEGFRYRPVAPEMSKFR